MSSLLWRNASLLDPQCRMYGVLQVGGPSASRPIGSPAFCCFGPMDAPPPDQQSLLLQHLHQWLTERHCHREANIPTAAPSPMPSAVIAPTARFHPSSKNAIYSLLMFRVLQCGFEVHPQPATPAPVPAAMGPSAPVAIVHSVGCTGCFGRQPHPCPLVYGFMGKTGFIFKISKSSTF